MNRTCRPSPPAARHSPLAARRSPSAAHHLRRIAALALLCTPIAAMLILSACGSASTRTAGASARQPADLLVLGGTVVTMDAERRVIPDGAVAIAGGRIAAVGGRADVQARFRARQTIDAAGHAVLPGLVNTHTHAAMSLFRGIADDLRLKEWLENYIFPAEARNVDPDFVRWGTRLAALEMIRTGTTTFADMYYFEDVVAEATEEAGLRGVLGQAVLDFPAPDHKTPADALAYTERFLQRWRNHPTIVAAVAPHSAYTASAETLRQAAELARRFDAPLLIHVGETSVEADQIRAKQQDRAIASPVAFLDALGLLGPRTLAAHSVWVSDADIATLRRTGTGVAHNPSSNMKLASGVAPVARMLKAGLAVGLGTDGVAGSNNDLCMFEEMDLASKLAKVTSGDPRALPAAQVLEMATIMGARALAMEQQIGSIEPGKRADLITVRLRNAHSVPMYDVTSQLVYALKGSDVQDVVVEGRLLMRSRRVLTLNEEEIFRHAERLATQVRRSLQR
jgi:5-methylthioadenosine/S-adenosylhomocysteine deaminase